MIDMCFRSAAHITHETSIAFPEHTHSADELVYYVRGEGYTSIEQQKQPYQVNHFAFYKEGTRHDEINLLPSEILLTTFRYQCPKIDLEEGVFFDGNKELLHQLKKLRRLSLITSPYQSVLLEACLANILVTVARIQKQQGSFHVDGDLPRIDWNLVMDTIDSRCCESIDFHEIATQFHYSYSRFRHLFSEHFSMSPQEYLIERRLEQAECLLELTDLSITEIAYRSGFSSSSNFSKAFKKHYDVLPKEYRALKR